MYIECVRRGLCKYVHNVCERWCVCAAKLKLESGGSAGALEEDKQT